MNLAALAALLLALLSVTASPAWAKSKPKPKKALPAPAFHMSASYNGASVVLKGGFSLTGKPLKTYVKWSEQLLDLSGNPLPTSPSGYQVVKGSQPGPGSLATTLAGTSTTIPVSIPGAAKMVVNVTASTPARSGLNKPGSAKPSFNVEIPFDQNHIAVGTAAPTFSYSGGAPSCRWDPMMAVTNATFSVQTLWTCQDVQSCTLQAMPPQAPTDVVPAINRVNGIADGTVAGSGIIVYGLEANCGGYLSISQMWIRIGYEDANGAPIDSCELPLSGVTSFTLPSVWAGYISAYGSLLSFDPTGKLTNANQYILNQPPYDKRTDGSLEVCQAFHLPAINTSGINPS